MCGITGIFNLNKEPVPQEILKKMTDILGHRGPDDSGYYIDKYVAFGHRRLSILDITDKGRQPQVSKNGEWVILFNGCIYNFRELRNELFQKGVVFVSKSDTEVILEGVAYYGTDFIKKLNGMFAIVLWNTKKKKLHMVRDRYGIKPLYYLFDRCRMVFSSEIKSIISTPYYSTRLDLNALNEYFTFQNLFTPNTLFKNITLLPPGNIIEVDSKSSEIVPKAWWDYDFSNPDYSMSFDDAKEETVRLLEQAVKRQMVSDVPVGTYLSGGMDSGSITSIASREVERMCTFTCGFDMSQVTGIEMNYDERKDAELISNYLKTEHYEQVINAGDIRWSLPRVVWHLEDLRVGMSYPNYYISRLASKFVKVCLQGTGGDELFGGYPWRYYKILHSVSKEEYLNNYYKFWQRLVPDEMKMSLFTEKVFLEINTDDPKRIFNDVFNFNSNLQYDSHEDHIQNSMYFEIKTFLHGLLIVGDRLSMASGLEERYPFLDNDLVEFAQKIPVKYKLGNLEAEIKRINENEPGSVKRPLSYQHYDDGK
ncbi:MAG: asparagine synthase (glutamine-hydrolyzing), partial [Ignavibacteria bacterium]|nr:asparagine synthase (glutamine-hydrolyzing) [Ignavibacteria bacterium]